MVAGDPTTAGGPGQRERGMLKEASRQNMINGSGREHLHMHFVFLIRRYNQSTGGTKWTQVLVKYLWKEKVVRHAVRINR